MNYVDVCTGIDAASVAWAELGWRCAAVAEIEPFPCAVLAERFGASRPEFMPQVEDGDSEETARDKRAAIKAVSKLPVVGKIPNRGDFTTIQGDEYGAVDLLVGGTPCQDFSVAGLRAGMDGKRGQLTVEFAKLAHRLVAKARTRWVLWENVPGVLSIDGGEAFATFLGILAKRSVRVPEGGWANSGIVAGGDDSFGLAYRVLDAQYAGVPQRRRRVFVVGYFGDWRRTAAVLFERHSLSGDSPPRREKGQVAPTIPARSLGGGGLGTDFDLDGGVIRTPFLSSSEGHFDREDYEQTGRLTPITMSTGQAGAEIGIGIGIGTTLNCNHEAPIVTHSLRGEGFDASEDGTGRGTPLVPVGAFQNTGHGWWNQSPVATTIRTPEGGGSKEANLIAFSSKDHGADAGDISPTLRSMSHNGSHANGGGQVAVAIAFSNVSDGSSARNATDIADPLTTRHGDPGMCAYPFAMNLRGRDGGAMPELDELASIRAASGGSSRSYIGGGMAVRRLTPRECERLQGFPDDFTKISDKTADGPRYKALGNSMAVPVMRWLGERIQMVEDLCTPKGEVIHGGTE